MATLKLHQLSPRKRQVIELLAQGKSIQEVAKEMGISSNTVRNQLIVMYQRFQVHSMLALLLCFYDLAPKG